MRKKILLLTTGGTIASVAGGEGLEPIGSAVFERELQQLRTYYDIDVRDVMCLDSSNIRPEEWQAIAREVFESREGYDGIVVSHGTDTMAYTASAVTYMLPGIDVPVVFTGSQLPLADVLSDGPDNLRTAFAMAASGYPGVYLAFDRKVMLGCRAVKVRSMDFAAFESVNAKYAGIVSSAGLVIDKEVVLSGCRQEEACASGTCCDAAGVSGVCETGAGASAACKSGFCGFGEARLATDISDEVFLIKLTPGLNPMVFNMLGAMGYKGIVIEAFGLGGINVLNKGLQGIRRAIEDGISIVVTTQCLYDTSDLGVYQVGNKLLDLGVIQGRDMTTEAAMTKLMWAIGQGMDQDEIKAFFAKSVAGEITE
ncbi:MAG: asparaginase [Firmicutes bacterium]|nr:asparaginase [Bacillota bacterium]